MWAIALLLLVDRVVLGLVACALSVTTMTKNPSDPVASAFYMAYNSSGIYLHGIEVTIELALFGTLIAFVLALLLVFLRVQTPDRSDNDFVRFLKTVGTVLDDVIDQIPDVNHMSAINTIPECISRLVQGTVDACTVDANDKEMYEETYPDYVVLLFEDDKGFDTEGVDPAMAVVKGDPQGYLPVINKVINDMTSEERQKLWDEASERTPE